MSDLQDLVTRIAGWAREGEQIEAYAAEGRETQVKVYDAEVESFSSATSAGVGIRVLRDQRQGFAYAGSLDPDVVEETLAEARDNVSFGTPDEYLGLAVPDGVEAVDLDLWRDELEAFPSDRKIELVLESERRAKASDPRIKSIPSSTYSDGMEHVAIATSTGIVAAYRQSSCMLFVYAMAGDDNETQTGYGYSIGRGPDDLDIDEAVDDAVERATRMLGAHKPPSARLSVVLDPSVTSTLLSVLGDTLSGESVLKGRSLFANRVGESVAAPMLVLTDDPTNPLAYGAATYDDEGLASRPNRLISEGVLEGFLYDSYSGRRAGVPSTAAAVRSGFKSGPGVGARALSLVPGDRSQDEIVAMVGEGLLVQSITGVHSGVNEVSGDFSVGADGLLIRGGATAEPVREITIASTIQRMLKDVIAVGNDLEWLPGSAAGVTLAIGDMSMSGA